MAHWIAIDRGAGGRSRFVTHSWDCDDIVGRSSTSPTVFVVIIEDLLMLFSKKNILTKGKKPLYAASRVINASCGTFARCWSHSANKTTALLRTVKDQGFRRAYSSKNTEGLGSSGAGPTFGLPFYRTYFHYLQNPDRVTDSVACSTGKLINAWTQTPTKWYPLPLAVGALLLVAMQYRKKAKRAQAQLEADLNENGYEVIKLKGPWQVRNYKSFLSELVLDIPIPVVYRSMLLVLYRLETCPVSGAISIRWSFLFGSDLTVLVFMLMLSVVIWMKSNLRTFVNTQVLVPFFTGS